MALRVSSLSTPSAFTAMPCLIKASWSALTVDSDKAVAVVAGGAAWASAPTLGNAPANIVATARTAVPNRTFLRNGCMVFLLLNNRRYVAGALWDAKSGVMIGRAAARRAQQLRELAASRRRFRKRCGEVEDRVGSWSKRPRFE